jgi:hypothetical protein
MHAEILFCPQLVFESSAREVKCASHVTHWLVWAQIAFTLPSHRLRQHNIVSAQKRISLNRHHPLLHYTTAGLHYSDLVPNPTVSRAIVFGATTDINKRYRQTLASAALSNNSFKPVRSDLTVPSATTNLPTNLSNAATSASRTHPTHLIIAVSEPGREF